jgi:hypothetical protein
MTKRFKGAAQRRDFQVGIKVTKALRDRLMQERRTTGQTLSEVCRVALEQFYGLAKGPKP